MQPDNKKDRKDPKDSGKKSPWDPVERKKIEFEKLDLKESWEEDLKAWMQKKREHEERRAEREGVEVVKKAPRKRRNSFKDMPVWKAKDIPTGWHPIEDDLADE